MEILECPGRFQSNLSTIQGAACRIFSTFYTQTKSLVSVTAHLCFLSITCVSVAQHISGNRVFVHNPGENVRSSEVEQSKRRIAVILSGHALVYINVLNFV